jgi:hypothetical protein
MALDFRFKAAMPPPLNLEVVRQSEDFGRAHGRPEV